MLIVSFQKKSIILGEDVRSYELLKREQRSKMQIRIEWSAAAVTMSMSEGGGR